MGDSAKPFRVTDRRRFDKDGRRREDLNPHLRPIDASTIQAPLSRAVTEALNRLERASAPPWWPRTLRRPELARGFLLAAAQLQRAVGRLLMASEKWGEEYLLATAILGRALLENIGTFLAFLDHPDLITKRLAHDDYKYSARILKKNVECGFGNEEILKKEAEQLALAARLIGLTAEQIAKPESLKDLPTPGVLLGRARRSEPELELLGSRRFVFEQLHAFWYSNLSAFAHQRMRALQLATGCRDLDDAAYMEEARSSATAMAVLTLLGVLTELDADANGGRAVSSHVLFLWETLNDFNELFRRVYILRYRQLTSVPRVGRASP